MFSSILYQSETVFRWDFQRDFAGFQFPQGFLFEIEEIGGSFKFSRDMKQVTSVRIADLNIMTQNQLRWKVTPYGYNGKKNPNCSPFETYSIQDWNSMDDSSGLETSRLSLSALRITAIVFGSVFGTLLITLIVILYFKKVKSFVRRRESVYVSLVTQEVELE